VASVHRGVVPAVDGVGEDEEVVVDDARADGQVPDAEDVVGPAGWGVRRGDQVERDGGRAEEVASSICTATSS
jgi:hypothetical protein